MKSSPVHAGATLLLLLAASFCLSPVAEAQEQAPAAGTPSESPAPDPIVVPEEYLAPVKALEGDEAAFADKIWEMGDTEFKRFFQLNMLLADPSISPETAAAYLKERDQRRAQLDALAAYGMQRFENNARIRNFHGVVLYDAQGKQLEAVKEWHTAVSLDSDYSDPYNNLGMHYFHTGEYPLGFQNMDKALELEPKNPDYCYNMAQNYLIFRPQTEEFRGWEPKKIYKEAMKLSKKATKLAPEDYEILQDYAVNFLAAENFGVEPDWKDAIDAWVVARKHATNDDERFFTWLNEGRVWRLLEKKDEALRCFKEALAIRPESEVTQRNIEGLENGE